MTSLKDVMRCELNGWKSRLPACWQEAVGDVRLNFDDLGSASGQPCNSVWPRGNDIFRAFQNCRIGPNDVRVVIFGNEPYPEVDLSTGRAFEQGDIISFSHDSDIREKITDSLRSLVLAVLMTKCDGGALDGLADCGRLGAQSQLFDSWEHQGVMWLNTSLTFSCKKFSENHRELWKPFIERIIGHLVNRHRSRPVIFALWGAPARKLAEIIRQSNGTGRFCILKASHPSLHGCKFFADGNPLLAINAKLNSLGCQEIDWCPSADG